MLYPVAHWNVHAVLYSISDSVMQSESGLDKADENEGIEQVTTKKYLKSIS